MKQFVKKHLPSLKERSIGSTPDRTTKSGTQGNRKPLDNRLQTTLQK